MDYTDAVAAFFVPRQEGTALPVAVADGSPARRLRDACEPVAMHAVWSRTTNERLAQLGLDFLTSYVGGRGACLGEPTGAVVAAAFAWFEPSLVTTLWEAARSAVAHDQLVQARDESTVASLREVLAGEDPGEVASLLADDQEQPIAAALGDRLEEVCGRLNRWGELCIEAGAFPPDILKRAAD